MKRLLAATAATGVLAFAGVASAATYVEPWTASESGGISVAFGNNGLGTPGAESIPGETSSSEVYNAETGEFTNTFDFFLPDGIVGFTLSSIGFAANSSLSLSSLTFNGEALSFSNNPNGQGGVTVFGSGGPFPILAGGPQTLVISGTGGPDAVYSSTATFEHAAGAIPEPGAWALMILGFGGAGAMLRRGRNRMAFTAA